MLKDMVAVSISTYTLTNFLIKKAGFECISKPAFY